MPSREILFREPLHRAERKKPLKSSTKTSFEADSQERGQIGKLASKRTGIKTSLWDT